MSGLTVTHTLMHSHLMVAAYALHKAKILTSNKEKDYDTVTDVLRGVANVVGGCEVDCFWQMAKFYSINMFIGNEHGEFEIRRSTGTVLKWKMSEVQPRLSK